MKEELAHTHTLKTVGFFEYLSTKINGKVKPDIIIKRSTFNYTLLHYLKVTLSPFLTS